MSLIPISFAAPLLLFALALLPVIWWLTRLTPPKPTQEPFPPFVILSEILKPGDIQVKNPWWLTLLRLVLMAMIILALSEPVFNPQKKRLGNQGIVLLIVDNSWASAPNWEKILNTAKTFINEAQSKEIPVLIIPTTSIPDNLAPVTAREALKILAASEPLPIKPYQSDIVPAIKTALAGRQIGTLVMISTNIDTDNTSKTLAELIKLNPEHIEIITARNSELAAITAVNNEKTAISLSITRFDDRKNTVYDLLGYDLQSRPLIQGSVNFAVGERTKKATIDVPFELLNDIMRVSMIGYKHAGTNYLLDDKFRRKRIALFSSETQNAVNPLLTSSHYIHQAISPYVEFIDVENINLNTDMPQLLAKKPSAIILSDIAIPDDNIAKALSQWVQDGGTLIRFAGAKSATASLENLTDDPLMPVRLRGGKRQFGGPLTWEKPKIVAKFPPQSPFFGIKLSNDITVKQQVLAEPDLNLTEKTWASLEDGTPLVTAKQSGSGRLILFHISAETNWSNLPLSGEFSQMLNRIISLTRANDTIRENLSNTHFLPAYKVLSANGSLINADGNINPLEISQTGEPILTISSYPGLYGTSQSWRSVNLLDADELLTPIIIPQDQQDININVTDLGAETATQLKPWMLLIVMALLILDTIIVMIISGVLLSIKPQWVKKLKAGINASIFLITLTIFHIYTINDSLAQDAKPKDEYIIAQLETARLAYVMTGDGHVDRISKSGLDGLSLYLTTRTAIKLDTPIGLDLETSDLSFYSLIYWPMSDVEPDPSTKAIANIKNFMKWGGTVLFDTRNALSDFATSRALTKRTLKLQRILSRLDIPPLEPVPSNHVLGKSFYLLESFPGRYANGPLWIEALSPDRDDENRIIKAGDGVSPILITSNDFAGAWAIDVSRRAILATIPDSQRQRTMAYRTGVNIVMYVLTGNYKADQIHVPALLERLGQ